MFNLITRANSGSGGGSSALATTLGDKYVRQTRFALISSGTGGAVTLPANSTVILDDFGGVVDAVISAVASSRPTFAPATDASGNIITTSFDSLGNWVLSGTPTSYPVAILYRTRMKFVDVDNTATDIVGESSLENADPLQASLIGLSTASASPITSTDTVLTALGKAQAQISLKQDAISIFSFSKNSTTPNDVTLSAILAANDSATNLDVVISPKGTGGLSLQVADGTATGGNKRGVNSIDLQIGRVANTQVVTGTNAFGVGTRNTVSAANAVAMGLGNTASNTCAFTAGNGQTASGQNSVALGTGNSSSGTNSAAIGSSNLVNATSACALNEQNSATGIYSLAIGTTSSTFSSQARFSHSANKYTSGGDNQSSKWHLGASTTDATATNMSTDNGVTYTANTRITVQNNQAMHFKGSVIGKQTGSAIAAAVGVWNIEGVIVRGTTAASTILVGTPTITAITNTGTWGGVSITADTTNGALIVTVTGKAATTLRWSLDLITNEIIYV